ncbi:BLUF domain-containing protein [Yoonia algicola]|uniref:BLUF domain-containing protein n=1 Tax=Yoonia algicola TaxID=3137368 RepID=A0AAN0M7H4_9RHOB
MPYLQIVYASRPFGFDAGTLLDILFKARAWNAKADVTGCLICRDDIYLQLLEGPADNVTRIYKKILEDDRHVEVTQLVRRGVPERMFGKWAMRDDPVQSWMWSRDEIDAGAVNRATPEEVLAIFQRLADDTSKTEA